jgi:hypothetical protein
LSRRILSLPGKKAKGSGKGLIKNKMAKKIQTPRKSATGQWLYCNFSARPEEVAKWKQIAKSVDRSLSWWIRYVLNHHMAGLDEVSDENSNPKKPETVGVAEVSGDRARSGD